MTDKKRFTTIDEYTSPFPTEIQERSLLIRFLRSLVSVSLATC